jgi:hypothetical protein
MLGHIIPATRSHAICMAPNMRAAEVEEVLASHGLTPEAALLRELESSSVAWSWVVDGEVACMFGIINPDLFGEAAYPWFLTTPLVEKHSRQFARACKSLLPELIEHHPKLAGMVDARYTLSLRWLQWLGARIEPAIPWGVAGALFHHFELGD